MNLRELTKGIITENPLFVIVLGVCPSLATSGELKTAFAMGLAATFVCTGLMALAFLGFAGMA